MRQVVQRRHDVPPVHLPLIDLLRAVIQPRRIAQTHRIRRGEQPELRMRPDHARLVEQRQLALHLQHPLDHEHHIGPARVIFVEHQRAWVLQCPRQDPLAKLGDLLAILQHDGILADQVDAADVAVQVDPDARPVQPRRHLLDVRGLPRPVVSLHQHPPVELEAGADRQRRLAVELIGRVQLRHMFGALRIGRHHHVDVHAEGVARIHLCIGQVDHAGRSEIGQCETLVQRSGRCCLGQQITVRKPAHPPVCAAAANRPG